MLNHVRINYVPVNTSGILSGFTDLPLQHIGDVISSSPGLIISKYALFKIRHFQSSLALKLGQAEPKEDLFNNQECFV